MALEQDSNESSQVHHEASLHKDHFFDEFLLQLDAIHSYAVRHAYGYGSHACSSRRTACDTTPKRSRADSGFSVASSSVSHPSSSPSSLFSQQSPQSPTLTISGSLNPSDVAKLKQQQYQHQLYPKAQLTQLNSMFDHMHCQNLVVSSSHSTPFASTTSLHSPFSQSCSNFAFDTLPIEKYLSIPLSEQECMEANMLFDELITMD